MEPTHAEAFFSVSSTGEIHERLSYDYVDEGGYYRRVLSDQELLDAEITKLSTNMQRILDAERVEINGRRTMSDVEYVDIIMRDARSLVSAIFLIDFCGQFERINRIETWIEEEEAPYDFEIFWRFPRGTRLLEVHTQLEYDNHGDILSLWASTGDRVGGYERLVFELPER